MGEDRSFHGSPRTGGRRDRWVAGLVAIVIVAFVGVAIAKPWGGPVEPARTPAPSGAAASPPPASPAATGPAIPANPPSVEVGPLPMTFTTPLAPSPATWTGLRWRRLAHDDPLGLLTAVVGWRRGWIAVGSVPRIPATPVWTSTDGAHWEPLLFGTATTFWPGLGILAVAELGTHLVAITETMEYCGAPCPVRFELPVMAWTSSDGRTWKPPALSPMLAGDPGSSPLVAAGPSGMLVATSGTSARLALSADGATWEVLPAGAFPAAFALSDLRGTPTGYVAVGRSMTSDGTSKAASLWSRDGRLWGTTATILPTPRGTGPPVGSAATSVALGLDGMIAIGGTTAPGAALWWESPDGRRWTELPAFPPLGPTVCGGQGCAPQPDGVLAGDGQRIVAIRGGPDAGAWVSSDGRSWASVSMSGDLPAEDATRATLLPAGILLSDGATSWFGEAIGG